MLERPERPEYVHSLMIVHPRGIVGWHGDMQRPLLIATVQTTLMAWSVSNGC
jgi:hypothetical protein